jgi:hypothetical protein
MTTYVLGAGASVHAGYPLAKDLGKRLHAWTNDGAPARYRCRGDINTLFETYDGLADVDAVWTDLHEGAPDHGRLALGSSLAVTLRLFFAGLSKSEAHLYHRLATERIRPYDTIITFNYDIAVERELKRAKLWEVGGGYGRNFIINKEFAKQFPSRVSVLKLHGSINWSELNDGITPGASVIRDLMGPRPVIWPPSGFQDLGYDGQMRDDQTAHIRESPSADPALKLGSRKQFHTKTNFGPEHRDFWDDLWGQAAAALSTSQKVVIIGYSMPKSDERARDLLLEQPKKSARIAICCGSRSGALSEEFKSRGFHNVTVPPGKGRFEDFLECPALVCA